MLYLSRLTVDGYQPISHAFVVYRLWYTVTAPVRLSLSGTGVWLTTTIYGSRACLTASHTASPRPTNSSYIGSKSTWRWRMCVCVCVFHFSFENQCLWYGDVICCFWSCCMIRLKEHGATSLGPAALASVAMASRYPGSKVRKSKGIFWHICESLMGDDFPDLLRSAGDFVHWW